MASDKTEIELSEKEQLYQLFEVRSPKMWSPEYPNMYTIQTNIWVDGIHKDQFYTSLGIRSLELRGSEGFFLNDTSIKFKGLSNHHTIILLYG